MRKLEAQPIVTIGHLTDQSERVWGFFWWGHTEHYRTFAHFLERPAAGSDLIDLECHECGEELVLRLDSLERQRRTRRRLLTTAAVGFTVTAATVALGLITDEIGKPLLLSEAPGVITLLAFLASLPVVGIAVFHWWRENGMRLHSTTGRTDPKHCRIDGTEIIRAVP
ncbi:hypothetical protein AB0B28_20830 [Glycomyces sp. NPDC046736]|uniref:hypothetical protein n=1 Tax=Glycomyces sp. NPDC046736 TaxID=3155615 RepID=UPI003403DB1A